MWHRVAAPAPASLRPQSWRETPAHTMEDHMRAALTALALFALPAGAAAQECMVLNNMMMCTNGAMAFNFNVPGVPLPPATPGFMTFNSMNFAAPGATQWSTSQTLNPDGSRTLRTETATKLPDGSVDRKVDQRIVFPNGQSCRVSGGRLSCD
jgi:hypothetical protein